MTAPLIEIADAIVTALNAADLSQALVFERDFLAEFQISEIASLHGKVVPRSDSREMGSASVDNATVAIDIAVAKRLRPGAHNDRAEIDGLIDFCEEIKAVLNRQRLAGAENAVCIALAQEAPYSSDHLAEMRVFITVITATFLTTVAV